MAKKTPRLLKTKLEGKDTKDKETSASEQNGEVVTKESSGDEDLFTTYRMEMDDQRSREREELTEIVRSDKATAKKKRSLRQDDRAQ